MGEAQKRLGEMYFFGNGVQPDYRQAAWLTRAASLNVPGAEVQLQRVDAVRFRRKKLMLRHLNQAAGLGAPGDLEFNQLLAEEDMGEAQKLLGDMYLSGKGVPRDWRQASIWLSRTAKHRGSGAAALLRQHFRRAAQRNGSDDMAFLQGAAEEGVDEARYVLEFLKCKEASQRDYRQTAKWLSRAAKCKGSETSELLRQELRQASERRNSHDLEFLHGAAEEGVGEAQKLLGEIYLFGKGIPLDCRKAIKWLELAASRNEPGAKDLLHKAIWRCKSTRGIDPPIGPRPTPRRGANALANRHDWNSP